MTGEATANVVTRCSRCLEEVRFPISAKLDAEFTRQPDPEDPDQYVFEASSIDLTDAIRDALTLELSILREFCGEASAKTDRYSTKEIRILSTVDVRALQKQVDALCAEQRRLDNEIQQANWMTEIDL